MQAHIVPVLAHNSLVFINMLCDTGCKVGYYKDKWLMTSNNIIVWQRTQEPSTRLWILPLNPITLPDNLPVHTSTSGTQYAGKAYRITSKGDLIQYPHQCILCPPKKKLIKAIKNNQLTTWTGLTETAVDKYFPDSSPETDKSHMKQ